jgi:very-short-patch-repair endonuclease
VVDKPMALHYNKSIMKQRRKSLRHSMPKAEVILWTYLSRRQMHGYKFRRQYSVDQYVLDFYCPRLKLAVEVDGESHFKTGAKEYDKIRQEYIETFGIQFLRVTNDNVCHNIEGVVQTIYNNIDMLVQKMVSKSIGNLKTRHPQNHTKIAFDR